jgi:hypothetical protein
MRPQFSGRPVGHVEVRDLNAHYRLTMPPPLQCSQSWSADTRCGFPQGVIGDIIFETKGSGWRSSSASWKPSGISDVIDRASR